jgi:hypothetical protein
MSTWQQTTHLHHRLHHISLIWLLTQTCFQEFESGLPTQNNPSIIQVFKKLAHPTPKKKNKIPEILQTSSNCKSPGYKKELQKFISTSRSHKRKHFHRSSFSFSSSSSSRIFRFLLIFEQEGYSLRSVIEDGSCMQYKIECGYCCQW